MISWSRPPHQTFILSRILNHANEMWLVFKLGFLKYMLQRVDGYGALPIPPTQGWAVRPAGPRQHSNSIYEKRSNSCAWNWKRGDLD